MFVQSPAFALAAVAALTLGIAVNTAIFSVVNAVLLRPLPFPNADRIVFFMSTAPQRPRVPGRVAGQVRALPAADAGHRAGVGVQQHPGQLHRRQLSRAAARRAACRRTSSGCSARRRCSAARSPRTRTARAATRSSCSARASGQTRLNSDPQIVGKAMSLGGVPHTVIGVLGDFDFADLFGQPAASVGAVPARSEHRRSGPLLPVRRPAQGRRLRSSRRRRG